MALKDTSQLPVALWAIPVPEFGGVARHVVDSARAGLPGYQMIVLAPEGELTRQLQEQGTEVITAQYGPDYGFATSFKSLLAAIKQVQPHILHSHLAYSDVVACAVIQSLKLQSLVKKSVRVPSLVTTEHGIAGNDEVYHGSSWRSRLMAGIHRVRLAGTDAAIAVSRSTAEQMRRKWGASSVNVVLNGVHGTDLLKQLESYRTERTSQNIKVLSLSRLSPEKGLDVLLEAFAHFSEHNTDAYLTIAGSGPLREVLEDQARILGIETKVHFPGFVDSVQAMAEHDILVQLSVWENLSYTLIDAHIAGMKTIATDVGGNSEIVVAEGLVPAITKDNREDVIKLVAQKLTQKAHTEKPSQQQWVSAEEMTANIVNIYQKVSSS
ncbi:glycosyltransferase [Rothia sp. P7208]|uniref:glycosyltransferase n=1 Tax=Rothia sp. P7208 TaxID=3402660 RepID=UPI003AD379BE